MSDLSEALQAQLQEALAAGESLRVRGGDSYASFFPVAAGTRTLDTRDHVGVVDYDPTEMVITVRSGTRLAELDDILAGSGQRLGVEVPHLSDDATVGGAIAMGFSGSSRPFTGALRDFVLGVRILNGDGDDLRFGGRVIKNVAGYDLSRLMVGSRGRLGVILEVTLRVLPKPEQSLALSFHKPGFRQAIEFTDALLAAAEPLTGASYYRSHLYLRFAGREATMARLQQSLGGQAVTQSWWSELRDWKMPWGRPTHIGYRDMRFREPQANRDWLVDWNGGLVWTTGREPTASTTRELGQALKLAPVRARLEDNLVQAFDPRGVFGGGAG